MHNGFDDFRRAAPQGIDGGDVAAAHMGEHAADGDLVRRNDDVQLVASEQVHIAGAVDDADDAFRAEVFGEQACHDIVFVVVGERAEYVDFVDVFAREQAFIGGRAVQYQRVVQLLGKPFGALGVVFDDFDVEFVFHFFRKPKAHVAAARNHHAVVGLVVFKQHIHHRRHVFGINHKGDFVAFFDDGFRLRHNQACVAVDGGDLAI